MVAGTGSAGRVRGVGGVPVGRRRRDLATDARSRRNRFSLGHCGLDSPIDVDGALWDPVGAIDADATEAINAADGEFRRTGPTMAEFVTATGFRVALVRHEGRKSIPLCD